MEVFLTLSSFYLSPTRLQSLQNNKNNNNNNIKNKNKNTRTYTHTLQRLFASDCILRRNNSSQENFVATFFYPESEVKLEKKVKEFSIAFRKYDKSRKPDLMSTNSRNAHLCKVTKSSASRLPTPQYTNIFLMHSFKNTCFQKWIFHADEDRDNDLLPMTIFEVILVFLALCLLTINIWTDLLYLIHV